MICLRQFEQDLCRERHTTAVAYRTHRQSPIAAVLELCGNPPGGRKIRQRHIEGEAELPGELARGATEVIEAAHAATLRPHRRMLNTPWRP
jgi:hypothetical protein